MGLRKRLFKRSWNKAGESVKEGIVKTALATTGRCLICESISLRGLSKAEFERTHRGEKADEFCPNCGNLMPWAD